MEIARTILLVGQFVPDGDSGVHFKRLIEEEGAVVHANLSSGLFDLSISPSISNPEGHLGKRLAAGVYFEIAAKYAEKVGGEIVQRATVAGCNPGSGTLLLARYPSMPLSFERVCPGFRGIILGELGASA